MTQTGQYYYYGTKEEELSRWSHSHPGSCPVCCDLDTESWSGGIPIRLAGLFKSRENCVFCDVILEAIQTTYFPSLMSVAPASYISAFTQKRFREVNALARLMLRMVTYELEFLNDELKSAWFKRHGCEIEDVLTVEIFPLQAHQKWPFFSGGALIPGSTSSEQALEFVRACLKECDQSHPGCGRSSPFVPRRLLTVNAEGESTALIEFDEDHEPVSYACLSHCWGSHQPLTTTTATLQQRKGGFEWHELPKTFQEAICLSRKLGLAYLWVDSLCIVQDDGDDWDREASKMADVYSNSYITIAASASKNDTEGCFRVSDCPAYKFQTTFTDGTRADFIVRKEIEHNYPTSETVFVNTKGRWTIVGSWPLMQRAWAFQERLLSPRVLHFGPSEVVWECQEQTLCECSEKDSQFDTPLLIRKSDWFLGLSESSLGTASQLWQKIVGEYSCRRLTFQEDILSALSGVARKFHESGGYSDTYLAGMWRRDLMQQLMWTTRQPTSLPMPTGRRKLPAPSWSWAAFDGSGVTFFQSACFVTEFREEAKIMNCSCKLRTPHIYGEVVAGHLRLQAQVVSVGLHHEVIDDSTTDNSTKHYLEEHDCDSFSARFEQQWCSPDFHYDLAGKYTSKPWESTHITEDVYLANMGIGRTKFGFLRRVALILRKTKYQEEFERIGAVYLDPRENQADDYFQTCGKEMILDIV